ncbi:type IV conjugative transfer system lipoprotein TraV [Edwardsiella tarda]|uniref:Type IV conjugative transfer system protein TraV n=1 Tax=Edwardsiella tarda TaxID=636 RepID=A0A2A7U7R2_EDWTA|nr:type IV conjugative transfer system lipoprotein TraV [Edwardsiella tarda]PEH74462.1 type IV conjugative transfer system protein TraV [Edwardsiella tarda]
MQRLILTVLGGALLLSGCAGTNSNFECNATTSDTCMTMQQANEKAKLSEESDAAKPVAASLPRLAEGNFAPAPAAPAVVAASRSPFAGAGTAPVEQRMIYPVNRPISPSLTVKTAPLPVAPNASGYPRPLRVGEQIAQLWIAPYIDKQDVYHQPSQVLFVISPSRWGKPRI